MSAAIRGISGVVGPGSPGGDTSLWYDLPVSSDQLLLPPVRPVARPIDRVRRVRGGSGPAPGRRRRAGSILLRSLLLAVVLVVAALAWVGVRGAMAVSALLDAQPALQDVATSLASSPTPTVLTSVEEVQGATARARALVSDPVWSLVQGVPVLGPQLEAVRGAVTAADVLAADALHPAVTLAGTVRTGPFGEGEGYAALVAASEVEGELEAVALAVLEARSHVAGVTADVAVPGLSSQVADALSALDELADIAAVVSPGLRGLLVVAGQDPGATAVVVLAPDARPLGGAVERVLLVEAAGGEVERMTPLDPAAVVAAAQASPAFAAAAQAEQALLAGRPAELASLTSTAGAGAALHDGVAAVTGTAPRAVLFLTPAGLDALGGARQPLTDVLAGVAAEERAAVLDAAADAAVRSSLALRGEAQGVARAIRGAVLSGGLRVWFADAALQAEVATTRAGGALPSTTTGGVPVTLTLDAPGPGPVVSAVRAGAGSCGALWWRRAEAVVAADLDWSPYAVPADVPADAPVPRVLLGLPRDAVVVSVTDGSSGLRRAVHEVDGRRTVVAETPAGTGTVEVRLRGRGDDADRVTVTPRGAVPPASLREPVCS